MLHKYIKVFYIKVKSIVFYIKVKSILYSLYNRLLGLPSFGFTYHCPKSTAPQNIDKFTKLSLTINSTGEITWAGVPLIKRDPTVTISTLRTNNIRPEVDSGTIRFDGPIETNNIMTKGLSLSAGLY